jgi:hypothetical protein
MQWSGNKPPNYHFRNYLEIENEAFPPAEQLSEEQMKAIQEGILTLWEAWGIYTEIPREIPVNRSYQVITDYWRNEPISYASEGQTDLQLCQYNLDACPWGNAHCQCKDFEIE